MLKLDVLPNLNSLPLEEVAELYSGWSVVEKFSMLDQFKTMKQLGRMFKIDLTNEQLLFICISGKTVLSDSGPGAGKTTCSKFALIHAHIFLGVDLGNALVLMFTGGAAEEYARGIDYIINGLNATKKKMFQIRFKPTVKTLHALARAWIREYKFELGFDSVTIENILLEDPNAVFNEIMSEDFEELDLTLPNEVKKKIQLFYNYHKETGIDLNTVSEIELKKSRYYPSKQLDLSVLIDIYNAYDRYKAIKNKYDFTDFILKFEHLLDTRADIVARLSRAYRVVFVDEYQDMSLSFIRILKKLIHEDTHAKFMGDSDQTLFDFRGSEAKNMLEFKEAYNNGVVTSLTLNMRCPAKIVELSNLVINTNHLRYDKQLYGFEKPYSIITEKYNSRNDVVNSMLDILHNTPPSKYKDMMLLYRNSRTSALLTTRLLFETNIPFTVISGARPFGDLLSRSILTFLTFVFDENTPDILKQLNRFTPLSKDQAKDVFLDYSNLREYYESVSPNTRLHGTLKTMFEVRDQALRYERSTCLKPIVDNIRLYYLNFLNSKMLESGEVLDDELFEIIEQFFLDPELSCMQIQKKLVEYMDKAKALSGGVRLATIHTAKGLEAEEIHMLDLDRNFPSKKGLDENLTEEQAQMFLEEEVRVFYVGITRTKKVLHVYHNESPFYSFFEKIDSIKGMEKGDADKIKMVNTPVIPSSNVFQEEYTPIVQKEDAVAKNLNSLLNSYKRAKEERELREKREQQNDDTSTGGEINAN